MIRTLSELTWKLVEFPKCNEAIIVSVDRNSSWGGVVVGISILLLGVATGTGLAGGSTGTSVPSARASVTALGGL